MMLRIVGLKVLKNRPSEHTRLAAGGETFLISDRDKIAAELMPYEATRSQSFPDALLFDAVRDGLVTPALQPTMPLRTHPGAPLDQMMEERIGDRGDR